MVILDNAYLLWLLKFLPTMLKYVLQVIDSTTVEILHRLERLYNFSRNDHIGKILSFV